MGLLPFLRIRNQSYLGKQINYIFRISRCHFHPENSTLCDSKRKQLQDEIQTFIEDDHSYDVHTSAAEAGHLIFNEKEVAHNLGESFTSKSSIWQFPWSWNKNIFYENSENIFAKGYDALEDYVHGYGNEDTQISAALTVLERFYDNKEKHEASLKQLRSFKSESSVAALLCTHLLSKLLVIPRNYLLDFVSAKKSFPDCPCGCGATIQYGSITFGSSHLFYGRPNVVLFPTNRDIFYDMETEFTVFNVQNDVDELPEKPGIEMLDPDTWGVDEDLNEEDSGDICTMENELMEFNEADINKICKQGIAASLWKHKRNRSNQLNNSVPMVPVCLINNNKYMVVMYNAEHDYLLKMRKGDCLTFFRNGKLQFTAIINMWLLIHHNLFCTEPDMGAIKNLKGTCGLIPRLGSNYFETVVKTSKFNYDVLPSRIDFEPDWSVSKPATRWKRPSKYTNKENEQARNRS